MRTVVIGAGIIGLSIAWHLHEVGVDVHLVDPDPAGGASHAAAGMLAAVSETQYGEEDFSALLVASAGMYPDFLARVGGASGRSTGYRATATLQVGTDSADRATFTDLAAFCRGLGLEVEQLTTREARRLEPLLDPSLSVALVVPDDHQVDPRVLCEALMGGLADAGVQLHPVLATGVEHSTDDPSSPVTGVRLDTGEVIACDTAVVACSIGATRLTGLPVDLRATIRDAYGDIIRLAPPAHLRENLSHVVRGLIAGHPVYLVPRADSSIVLGATTREDGVQGVQASGVYTLLRDAIRIMPSIEEFAISEVLARPRPMSPDNAPLLGPVGDGSIVVAAGLGRNGILLTPAVGAAVITAFAERLPGSTQPRVSTYAEALPDMSPFAADRFARVPA